MIEYLKHMNKKKNYKEERNRRVGFGLCELCSLKGGKK